MKIIKLVAENVKRIEAVEIEPDGTLQIIGGKNAQGKTSVLDAIWLALGGGAASRETEKPVRKGQTEARVELDLDDLVIERTWKGDKTSLKIRAKDGSTYSSPQTMLDSLVGRLSFDPLEFTRLHPKAQLEALLQVVDLGGYDPEKAAAERKSLYDLRLEVGRKARDLGHADIDPDVGTEVREEVSASELVRELQEASEQTRRQQADREKLTRVEAEIKRLKKEAKHLRKAIEDHPRIPDPEKLQDRIDRIDQENRAIRANNHALGIQAERERLDAEYEQYTTQIEKVDEKRAKALAKAKMPVKGLSFDEDGVLYGGVPFSQASAAEQIRVSLAMAMSMNPELRVIRILDGSLLDKDNLKLIRDMAKDQDYQVWIERVGDADKAAVIIEDGRVRDAD